LAHVRPGLTNAGFRKRVQQISNLKEVVGKQNAKAALVDPILIALGWDSQEGRSKHSSQPGGFFGTVALFLGTEEM
jgi:hypothetical protein